ncbi:hypothetical protein DPMN_095233 [Dreissena polymorpha]|uniref:Uncharacterized protein n=1 Tax=Dreissena polymorpha TaxID=45954 RepID=A0A9D4R2N6_DREPO|nr:hypothetical protein DPMN_095233 [Dreissena polymorpha]
MDKNYIAHAFHADDEYEIIRHRRCLIVREISVTLQTLVSASFLKFDGQDQRHGATGMAELGKKENNIMLSCTSTSEPY